MKREKTMKAAQLIAVGKYKEAYDILEDDFDEVMKYNLERYDFEGGFHDFINEYKKEVNNFLDGNYEVDLDMAISEIPGMEDLSEERTRAMVLNAVAYWNRNNLLDKSAESLFDSIAEEFAETKDPYKSRGLSRRDFY